MNYQGHRRRIIPQSSTLSWRLSNTNKPSVRLRLGFDKLPDGRACIVLLQEGTEIPKEVLIVGQDPYWAIVHEDKTVFVGGIGVEIEDIYKPLITIVSGVCCPGYGAYVHFEHLPVELGDEPILVVDQPTASSKDKVPYRLTPKDQEFWYGSD